MKYESSVLSLTLSTYNHFHSLPTTSNSWRSFALDSPPSLSRLLNSGTLRHSLLSHSSTIMSSTARLVAKGAARPAVLKCSYLPDCEFFMY